MRIKLEILIFWTKIAQKWCFWSKTEKVNTTSEYVHIQISIGTEFQLKLIILIFWTKFVQKSYFQSKAEKVNITIEFCIFGLDSSLLAEFYRNDVL